MVRPIIKRDKNLYESREVVESNDKRIEQRELRETPGGLEPPIK